MPAVLLAMTMRHTRCASRVPARMVPVVLLGLAACPQDERADADTQSDTDPSGASDSGPQETTSGTTEATAGTSDESGCNANATEPGEICDDHDATVIDLSTHGVHTCALLDTGAIRCWGRNSVGQLGYGTTASVGDDEPAGALGDVSLGSKALQVSSGHRSTCAVLDGGSVRCWGSGSFGLLGAGNEDTIGDDELPASVPPVALGGRAEKVAVGSQHACALLEGGIVRCWGLFVEGRLGLGNTRALSVGDDELPTDVPPVDLGGAATDLDAGYTHTCAVLEDGDVLCWGEGTSGRLGYGNTENVGDDETPAAVGPVDLGGRRVAKVTCGSTHTCVLLEDGGVVCWGASDNSLLGRPGSPSIGDDEVPGDLPPIELGGRAIDVDANANHTCAVLEGGAVRCWGESHYGMLGLGDEENTIVGDDETPAAVPPVDVGVPVSRITAGFGHTCALVESGTVRCWGSGEHGVLGYGNTESIGDDEPPSTAGDVPVVP